MDKQVTDSIDAIRKLSPQLNAATDSANELVNRIERFLNDECSVGVPAEVREMRIRREMAIIQGNDTRESRLCYDRVDGKFRIAVHRYTCKPDREDHGDDLMVEDATVPWASCPRGEKLATFVLLPALLKEIASEVQRLIERSTASAGILRQLVQTMTAKAD